MTKREEIPIEASLIIPCYNEENTIQLLLKAILDQNYPKEKLEIIIADALSEDQTRSKIKIFANNHPELAIQIIDNPKRTIPTAVNQAVHKAKGEFIIRLDAHSVPECNYIQLSVDLLKKGKAENIGGVWEIKPGSSACIAKAIAKAASHPIGAGDAKYRVKGNSGFVDTVPFGAFRRDLFVALGGFNEKMLANEDYEFNTRIRKNGGKVWLDTQIQSTYFSRNNLRDLSRQYWRYGFWKLKMLKLFPDSIRWRQIIPPAFVLFIIFFGLASLITRFAFIIFLSVIFIYLFALAFASFFEAFRSRERCFILMGVAFITMHLSWGGGFIYSFFRK